MPTGDLVGLITFVILLAWFTYALIYWTNLAWRFPDKFKVIVFENARRLPKWFPLRGAMLADPTGRPMWPPRLIITLVDLLFLPLLGISLYAIISALLGFKR